MEISQTNITRLILKRLRGAVSPTRVILFGSRARLDGDERSDYDLLVVCPFTGGRRAVMAALSRALEGLGVAVDVIVLTPEEYELDKQIPGTVARPAWLEGVVLYDAA